VDRNWFLIEPVARSMLNVVDVCCFWMLSPPQKRLQRRKFVIGAQR